MSRDIKEAMEGICEYLRKEFLGRRKSIFKGFGVREYMDAFKL